MIKLNLKATTFPLIIQHVWVVPSDHYGYLLRHLSLGMLNLLDQFEIDILIVEAVVIRRKGRNLNLNGGFVDLLQFFHKCIDLIDNLIIKLIIWLVGKLFFQ